jgi:phosphoribosyl 1,2-cyclic phosphate phosphodiesterase
MPEASLPLIEGLDLWLVVALRYCRTPCHFRLREALAEHLNPRRAILTHILGDFDHDALRRELPLYVEPAFDGMMVRFV